MPSRRTTIDTIRGLCLVNIFVGHLQLGQLNALSPSRLGFSDSADVFVLLSGISTALAFGGRAAGPFPNLLLGLWRRAARIFAFDLGIVAATLLVFATVIILRGSDKGYADHLHLLQNPGPATLLWHAVTLRQTVGHSTILRLYVALMLMAPIWLRLAVWRWWAPLGGAGLLWIVGGHFQLVMHNSLTGEPFLLSIIPWTLLFCIGLTLGMAMIRGVRAPVTPLLVVPALTLLLGYIVLVVGAAPLWTPAQEWILTRHEHFWIGASKTYQSPLRLLHVLSLAYLVMALPKAPLIRLLHAAQPNQFLPRLGRSSLPVFALGAVGAVLADEVLDLVRDATNGAWLPALLVEVAAIAAFLWLADLISQRRPIRAPERPDRHGPSPTLDPALRS